MEFDHSQEIITPDLTNILTVGGKALELPTGTAADRPAAAVSGATRYNVTINQMEVLGASTWEPIPTSATGTVTNISGVVAIANGGTGQTTAATAFNALAPSQTGNAGKVLTTNGTVISWENTASTALSALTDVTITTPTLNQMLTFDGADWVNTSSPTLTDVTLTGNINLSKASGTALLIDNGYGWRDLIGDITPRSTGTTAPTLKVFYNNIRDFSYDAGDVGDIRFHIPHDYAPGTDLFIHVHWSHNGTAISGTLQTDFTVTYAKGFSQAIFSAPVALSIMTPALTINNTPQYTHRIDEVRLSTVGGSSSQLNTSLIEVDGFIMVNYTVSATPTISGGIADTPFIIAIDIHYQSTGLQTKNKSPSFYA